MGGLHKGHLSIIKKAKKYKCKICVSIFVNPTQFNKKNDFKNYPRNIKSDIKKLKKLKINYLYLPTYKDIYSFKTKNKIHIDKFSKQLCGKFRKNHFKGVLNIINRFLEILNPKYIFLGIKDFQQLILIDKHIIKRKIKTKVIECKTIREKNGVACSTRNLNLNNNELIIASSIYKYLFNLNKKIKKNHKQFKINNIKNKLISLGITKIDYIEKLNIKNLRKNKKLKNEFKLFFSYYINKIRLIDNI
jgi:pantoate--beta-alanine ligase